MAQVVASAWASVAFLLGPFDTEMCYTIKEAVSEQTLDRIINIIDAPIDQLGRLDAEMCAPSRRP